MTRNLTQRIVTADELAKLRDAILDDLDGFAALLENYATEGDPEEAVLPMNRRGVFGLLEMLRTASLVINAQRLSPEEELEFKVTGRAQ